MMTAACCTQHARRQCASPERACPLQWGLLRPGEAEQHSSPVVLASFTKTRTQSPSWKAEASDTCGAERALGQIGKKQGHAMGPARQSS